MTVPNPTLVRRTKEECIRRAGKALADERAAQAARSVEEAALAAYRPEFGGPTLSELEGLIRAQRGLAVAA